MTQREDDYGRGFSAGWKAAMEFVQAGWPPSYTQVTSPPVEVDPCASCKPSPDATHWVCMNVACPRRAQVTC